MTEFANLFGALDAPAPATQVAIPATTRHPGNRLWRYALRRPDRRRSGSRLLGMLAPAAFQRWFIGFMRQFAEGSDGVLAVDGKTLRRFYDRTEQCSPLHPVSAGAEEHGWYWDNWPWTPNPTVLRHCPGCWKC